MIISISLPIRRASHSCQAGSWRPPRLPRYVPALCVWLGLRTRTSGLARAAIRRSAAVSGSFCSASQPGPSRAAPQLVVVTRRLCLDRLDRAESRRTTATAEPPEPREAPGGIADPAGRMMLHDEVCQAFSVVVDRLSPAERTSFILHDVFGFPFDAVAGLVGRTPAACRQLARRARLSVGTGPYPAGLAGAWPGSTKAVGLAERFIAVCEGGDVHGLIALLDPEVAGFRVVIGLHPMPAVRGAQAVAGRVMHRFGPAAGVSLRPFDLEGRAAVVVRRGEEVVAVVRLDDREGRIFHLHTVARPSLAR